MLLAIKDLKTGSYYMGCNMGHNGKVPKCTYYGRIEDRIELFKDSHRKTAENLIENLIKLFPEDSKDLTIVEVEIKEVKKLENVSD